MRIGFFGGSFDPPHLGHLTVAHRAAQAFALDRILFAPTARQPFKTNGLTASYYERLSMLALLCRLEPPAETHSFEPSKLDAPLPDGAPNFTVDTLKRLRNQLSPDDSIFALVGADAFQALPKWRSPELLLNLADWIVVSRPGSSAQDLQALDFTPLQMQRIHWLDGVNEPASATEIRSLLLGGSDCSGLLPASILEYIRTHRLYGTHPPIVDSDADFDAS